MKKVLLFAVLVAGLGFTSCSKSDCECTVSGVTTVYTDDDLEAGENMKDACDEADAVVGYSCKMV